ncbi:hypothetical protein [Paenibacillus taiwanensis]|uniref:hypothetical protein n=1 Tax=Paenibacillus taiwanensis TaxID=401638 RepID=UPI00041A62D1|nr:hypothetical protein [Paenibacillus taiwanensis]
MGPRPNQHPRSSGYGEIRNDSNEQFSASSMPQGEPSPAAYGEGPFVHEGAEPRPKEGGKRQPPFPRPPNCPLTVQKAALIAALLYDWLLIESVIINRNKSVQVILAGDFGKIGFSPDLFNSEQLAENVGLFEALEDAQIFPNAGEIAAEEASVVERNKKRKPPLSRNKQRPGNTPVRKPRRKRLSRTPFFNKNI